MTYTDRRPGVDHRGDGNDQQLGSRVAADGSRTARRSDVPAQLQRRRAASWRLPPMPSSDRRDPWRDWHDEPVSDRELESYRGAWWHLRQAGLPAVVPARILRAGAAERCDGQCRCRGAA